MSDSIRQFVRGCLAEAAISADAASETGMALFVLMKGQTIDLLMYSPARAANALNRHVPKSADKASLLKYLEGIRGDIVGASVGTVSLRKPRGGPTNGALEVISSAAEQGYGPLMYDIAMSIAPSHEIVPDRENVSSDARGVWSFYFHNRKDVKHHHIDDAENPKTPPKSDDGSVYPEEIRKGEDANPLNYSYSSTSTPSGRSMNVKHEEFVHKLVERLQAVIGNDAQSWVEKVFERAAMKYFALTLSDSQDRKLKSVKTQRRQRSSSDSQERRPQFTSSDMMRASFK